ncbi:MAG: 3-deoxy-8-phosphooctulonate synthase [Gemmatimonadetes bacterium]|nr:3-deoxy-8-phosphooctulonate synthase [Gemmatimonadota bacterium]
MFRDFFLIAGPCALEDHGLNLRIAEAVASLAEETGIATIFKASFDKANRSKLTSPRGPGMEAGLELLRRVKDATDLPVLTDIHEPHQAAPVAEVVDVIQIPAFLCRQTDLLVAAGETGRAVNIKKGQWMAPEEMASAVEKLQASGSGPVAVTERGTIHGYGDLVVDMRSFRRLRDATGCPTVFDGTHSVQRPGRADGSSGGDPVHIPALVRAAVAAGCEGLFLETHPDPLSAPSDGTNMLPLSELEDLIRDVVRIRAALSESPATGEAERPREGVPPGGTPSHRGVS